jgi:hypothetical protein
MIQYTTKPIKVGQKQLEMLVTETVDNKIDDINNFENNYNIKLPEDFKNFLLQGNGLMFHDDDELSVYPKYKYAQNLHLSTLALSHFYGFNTQNTGNNLSYRYYQQGDDELIPSGYLEFAAGAGGDKFMMSLNPKNYGQVYFYIHDKRAPNSSEHYWDYAMFLIADSFTEFFGSIKVD